MNIKQAAVLLLSLTFSVGTFAASKWSGEWFEIEIILISQLHDKSKQAEVFSEYSPLPQYHQSLDLLTPYLLPDIKALKQQLPDCDSPKYPSSLLEQASHLPELHPLLTLAEIHQLPLQQETLKQEQASVDSQAQRQQENQAVQPNLTTAQNEDDFFDRVRPAYEKADTARAENNKQSDSLTAPANNETSAAPAGITKQQKAFVAEAELAFSTMPFNYNKLTEQTPDTLCKISEAEFNQLNPDTNLYSYNGFLVNKMPLTVDGTEDLYSEQPYLVAKQSLQLNDIVKQLRRSKNFRPLLHMAWRQPVFDLPDATPVKLFAGDNFNAHYAKEQAKFLEQQRLDAEQEAQLSAIFANQDSAAINTALSRKQLLEQAKQQQLQTIFNQISDINDSESVLAQLDQPALSFSERLAEQSVLTEGPKLPIQPWYLTGFINVFLKGVYLNVAADFNILNLTLAQQSSLALRPNTEVETKAIRFQQQRRMISQEVHYFDHPYMGLIVQIRRHDRPEPPEQIEAEDQIAR
ncbi:hypothetical protein tinsulaeT_06290 [Thalassotalea insulae]|uniref:Uncharacterized protein n=1 Tax=Thalassotalea insulae TaxID=2056778 RepID=A0ABQ6GQ30_9GAMM|nr:CsiV family protein [Thalassotalea insulae]GLX77289.1 hypothetical protein tinsulaeT_06290 [Thalassotalea insulae]